jgi:hypothetical protein
VSLADIQEDIKITDSVCIVVTGHMCCGKTTILHLDQTYLYESFLLLTYNKKLRLETKARVDTFIIENKLL